MAQAVSVKKQQQHQFCVGVLRKEARISLFRVERERERGRNAWVGLFFFVEVLFDFKYEPC